MIDEVITPPPLSEEEVAEQKKQEKNNTQDQPSLVYTTFYIIGQLQKREIQILVPFVDKTDYFKYEERLATFCNSHHEFDKPFNTYNYTEALKIFFNYLLFNEHGLISLIRTTEEGNKFRENNINILTEYYEESLEAVDMLLTNYDCDNEFKVDVYAPDPKVIDAINAAFLSLNLS